MELPGNFSPYWSNDLYPLVSEEHIYFQSKGAVCKVPTKSMDEKRKELYGSSVILKIPGKENPKIP